jgi:hypothetical protein
MRIFFYIHRFVNNTFPLTQKKIHFLYVFQSKLESFLTKSETVTVLSTKFKSPFNKIYKRFS